MGAESVRRVRVLHVITRLERGGSTDNTLLTAAMADRQRYEVHVAAGPRPGAPSPLEQRAQQAEIRWIDVPDLCRAIRPLRDLRALLQLLRIVRNGRYDVVHTHTSKAGLLGRLAAWFGRVPCVIHTPHGHVFYGYYGPIISRFFVLLERLAARLCSRIVTLTERGARDHVEYGVAGPDKFAVVHSGIAFPEQSSWHQERDRLRAEWGIAAEATVIGTLGRLTAIKGQADLIVAFAELTEGGTDRWLLLVGDGEERAALEELATRCGVGDRLVWAGWRDDVYAALAAMDIFALPSINEGMGKALVEAMFVGLPCVATRVGGIPEIIRDGEEGMLVDPSSPLQLAAALGNLLADAELRTRCAAAARRRAVAYSAEAMVRSIERLYEEVLREKAWQP